jgi:predicted Zn-dependent protease
MKQENQTINPQAFAAITAKYIGATEMRGSRIKVTSQRGSKTYPYPYEYSRDEVFSHCVAKYLESVRDDDRKTFGQASHDGWGNLSDYAMGVLPSGEHVFVSVR